MNTSPPQYTADEFRERARSRLLAEPPSLDRIADATRLRLDPVPAETSGEWASVRRAAVLIPVRDGDADPTVILTERSHHMPAHAGQISFPGGRISNAGETPLEAALREAEEEIGLARHELEVLGFMDSYLTGTGYLVAPVVAVVDSAFTAVPEEREVASVFEVPLSFLMNPANHTIHEREISGQFRRFYAMSYGERFIWGATAAMLKDLYDRMYA